MIHVTLQESSLIRKFIQLEKRQIWHRKETYVNQKKAEEKWHWKWDDIFGSYILFVKGLRISELTGHIIGLRSLSMVLISWCNSGEIWSLDIYVFSSVVTIVVLQCLRRCWTSILSWPFTEESSANGNIGNSPLSCELTTFVSRKSIKIKGIPLSAW